VPSAKRPVTICIRCTDYGVVECNRHREERWWQLSVTKQASTDQMKSLQWLQKVGCLKNRAANLWSRTSTTSFSRRAPRRSCLADTPELSSPSAVPCPEFDSRRPVSPPPAPEFIARCTVWTRLLESRQRSEITYRCCEQPRMMKQPRASRSLLAFSNGLSARTLKQRSAATRTI